MTHNLLFPCFRFGLLVLAAGWTLVAHAQSTATGRVVAKTTGAPLAATTVKLEGQPTATTTDEAGRFSLPLPGAAGGAALVFSRIGYQTRTVPAAQLSADVALEEQMYQIGEVQVSYVLLRKLLLKNWKIAPTSLDAAAQLGLAALQKRDPKKAEALAKRPESLRKVLEMARLEFRDDGVVKAKMLLFGEKRRWQLDEETRTLTITDDEGQESPRSVTELTETRLALQRLGSDAPPIEYVPAD